ncbi:MAG: TRAP transporter substrate-binding protein DctP [Rhodospirillum sp.]|nr:TRAP transporter substrate-binding protein DctP [Rhodospirillum sp.]MCF8489708.1 TRAP transporter substrate-binding protein DctP [Rhodospirillum sp.]MCF8502571.1 TRAP transporter substrate-binding protein DctP [Rhodospirillum sp.]
MSFPVRRVRASAALLLAATLVPALAVPARAATLMVTHGYSPTHVISAHGIEPWMNCVKEVASGSVDFSYFPSGQVASIKDSLDALNSGLSAASAVAIGYVSGKMPLNGVAMLPNMGDTAVAMATAYGAALKSGPLADEFAANGVRPVFNIMLPVYQIVSRVGPIDTIPAFEGKVVRSGGGAMNLTLASLGASPAAIPSADMYIAMERGAVDATLSALASVKPYNLQEVMNALSTNGRFGSFATVFAISANSWEGLTGAEKAAVESCGARVESDLAAYLDAENEELKKDFAEGGATVYAYSDAVLAEMDKRLDQVSEDWVTRLEERGLPARRVLEDYRASLGAK